MNKYIIPAIAVIALIGGVMFFMNSQSSDPEQKDTQNQDVSNNLALAFQDELSRRALARGPHPVEGFDAQMLIDIFPGIMAEDFDGVTTGTGSGEGIHSFAGGELTWERTSNEAITSAEKSISQSGYQTLLVNLSSRLDMPVENESDVMAIVDEVDIPADLRDQIDSKSDLIRVTTPRPMATISSPQNIWGEARGSWYFEAEFPVVLVDWDGKIIAETNATAQGDWMTEEFVRFEAEIEFDNPSTAEDFSKKGTLIFQKANPSGLPENDDALEIPVMFE